MGNCLKLKEENFRLDVSGKSFTERAGSLLQRASMGGCVCPIPGGPPYWNEEAASKQIEKGYQQVYVLLNLPHRFSLLFCKSGIWLTGSTFCWFSKLTILKAAILYYSIWVAYWQQTWKRNFGDTIWNIQKRLNIHRLFSLDWGPDTAKHLGTWLSVKAKDITSL